MNIKTVHVVTDLDHQVQLLQVGKDNFTVVYGLQVKRQLSYKEAALEYGACIMHSATCAGKLSN